MYDAPEGAHARRRGSSTARWPAWSTPTASGCRSPPSRAQTSAGWVDDFYLRGEVRLVGAAPSCATTVAGRAREGGTLAVVRELRRDRVRVETVTPPVAQGWASRADVQELPPQGEHCGDIPPEDRHAH